MWYSSKETPQAFTFHMCCELPTGSLGLGTRHALYVSTSMMCGMGKMRQVLLRVCAFMRSRAYCSLLALAHVRETVGSLAARLQTVQGAQEDSRLAGVAENHRRRSQHACKLVWLWGRARQSASLNPARCPSYGKPDARQYKLHTFEHTRTDAG